VHTVRVSQDRFEWSRWDEELYGSMVVNAGSVWPTVDNFRTNEQRNLLLAVLSGGPLPLGDKIGAFVPIGEAIRNDGLILKPDVSMVPTDASIVTEAAATEKFQSSPQPKGAKLILPPLVAHTNSDFGSGKVEYVFAYSRDLNAKAPVSFSPREFGFTGDVYVYDYFNKGGWRQPAAQAIHASVDSQGSYFIIAPIDESGMAFLGDLSKFVPASHQRVLSLVDNGQIAATLEFNAPETVPISVLASTTPVVSAVGATVSAPSLEEGTGLYHVMVESGGNKQATIRIGLRTKR